MGTVRISASPNWRDKLFADPRIRADLDRRAKAIAGACNGQSSWGGYVGRLDPHARRPRAVVFKIDRHGALEDHRALRLLRGLDAGR